MGMEIYLLGPTNRIDDVVERLESFIWTEKFQAYGNFEMTLHSSPGTRAIYLPNRRLVQSNSDRVMRIEYVEDVVSNDGKRLLHVKGRSLESLTTERIAMSAATAHPFNWRTYKKPGEMMRNIYREMCVEGTRDVRDIYPDIGVNENLETGMIQEHLDDVLFEEPVQEMYGLLTKIGEAYDLGFKIVWQPSGTLTYRVYSGRNRSTQQSNNAVVLFSVALENLMSSNHIITNVDYRNFAMVTTPHGKMGVEAPGSGTDLSGVDRRILHVDGQALEGEPTALDIEAYHRKLAREAFAQHRNVEAFDGEITQRSQYVYGKDYHVGDLVELQGEKGHTTIMRVSEQIFSLDAEGYKSYPTLSHYMYVQPGSWVAWNNNKKWAELTTETWQTMP